MENDKKQVTVIAATTPAAFQRDVNRALAEIDSPELVFDKNRPFVVYIIHDKLED